MMITSICIFLTIDKIFVFFHGKNVKSVTEWKMCLSLSRTLIYHLLCHIHYYLPSIGYSALNMCCLIFPKNCYSQMIGVLNISSNMFIFTCCHHAIILQ